MAAIEAIVFAGAAGFAVIVVATILVIIGVHQEQRVLDREGRQTFAHHEPPTILALLARRVLGAHFNVMPSETTQSAYHRPGYPLPRYPDPDDLDLGYSDPDYPRPGFLGPDDPDRDPPWDDPSDWPKAG
ncbi:MAG: hypothetical protein ACRDRJ_07960 [Streptosporangiaceae bacterium]